jgi:poly(3-hydroxybutyrate) depolymerase
MQLKGDCKLARPVSILAMHGTKVSQAPYEGGEGTQSGITTTALSRAQCERGYLELLY